MSTSNQNSSFWPVILMSVIATLIGFSFGRFGQASPESVNREAVIAQAQAKGVELARLKSDAIANETRLRFQKEEESKIAEKKKLDWAAAVAKEDEQRRFNNLGLTPVSAFDNWKDIGDGWQARGVRVRYNMKDVVTQNQDGQDVTTSVPDQSSVYFEYALRRIDGRAPRLTRILFELFDKNGDFIFPGVCDVSGADAGIVYVRTGEYDLKGKTLAYCRVSLNSVGIVKYKNEYPTR